jgi:hypothetical protein
MLAMDSSIIGRTASAIESSRSRMSTQIVTLVRWPVGPAQRAVGAGLLALGLAGVLWCVRVMRGQTGADGIVVGHRLVTTGRTDSCGTRCTPRCWCSRSAASSCSGPTELRRWRLSSCQSPSPGQPPRSGCWPRRRTSVRSTRLPAAYRSAGAAGRCCATWALALDDISAEPSEDTIALAEDLGRDLDHRHDQSA